MRYTRKVNALQLKMAREIGEPFVREYEENDYCELEGTYDRDRLNKLGQLEDIEEELGIDLITLFKVLTEGIYRKTNYDIVFYNPSSMSITKTPHFGWALYHRSYTHLFTKDYGKDWALTKEELL